MSQPPIPMPLESFGSKPFSFYPPIQNIEHNEWVYRKGSWAEILVQNTKSALELWVPRRFVETVSSIEEPVMIVGLARELEYHAGILRPAGRRVVEMAPPVPEFRPAAAAAGPAPPQVHAARMDSSESRIGKLILGALVVGIAVCFFVILVFRSHEGGRVSYTPVVQTDLGFTAQDNYFDVVQKLGPPAQDRWKSSDGELQYRVLVYPRQSLWIILMGTEREKAHYIGAMDGNWKPVHSVELAGGRDSASMLKALPRF